ncbi:MAG: MlaD family protein [Mycobacterium sp.]|uniref:MlaD family protein n=1 Tax=Mycobacterium sp. TaxID=1785 RepID=UPI003C3FD487
MIRGRAALWRLAIAGAVAVVLLILVVNVIRQPVAARLRAYTAEFTDASGLHVDADVRVRGVRVGKVRAVQLERRSGQSVAAVTFTLDQRYGIVSATRLAIKFQALTGLRYVAVEDPAEQYSPADLVTRAPTTMTQPSLDVTALFNGLQPVFATLSPDDINTFAANAANYLTGDGGGLKPLLDSIQKLSKFASDREQVVATLLRNLSALADTMGGHSKDFIQILTWVNGPLNGALDAIDEFRKSQLYGLDFTSAVQKLLENAGFPVLQGNALGFTQGAAFFSPQMSREDIDLAMDRAFTRLDDFTDAFKFVPVFWDNVPPPSTAGGPAPCSHGRAQLPEQMDVLLNGQRVLLCNR